MSISIGDALLHLGIDKSGLDEGMRQATADIKSQMKTVGVTLAGFGASITGILGLSTKAAADEQVNIQRLSLTLKNLGVSYDDVKDSIESVILMTQRKTGIADDEQRDALNRLLLVTNDYKKSLSLLPTVLDLAAAGEMDTSTAAAQLGKAMLELEGGAEKVSIRLGRTTVEFNSLDDIIKRVQGSAEAAANPFTILRNEIANLSENIGSYLLPIFKEFVAKLMPIIDAVKKWADAHPILTRTLVILAAGIGGVSLAIGSLILLLPTLIAGIAALGTTIGIATGGITIALGLIATGAMLLLMNWDKVTKFFKEAWINIKLYFLQGIESVLDSLSKFTEWIPGLGKKIDELHDKISGMIEAEKVKKSLLDVEEALDDTTEIIENHTDATEVDTEALWANAEALKEQEKQLETQQKAYEGLLGKARDATKQFQYEQSAAGKLKITTNDVTTALISQGWTAAQLAGLWQQLGDDVNYADLYLKAVGKTAEEIDAILKGLTGQVGDLTTAYSGLGETVKEELPSGISESAGHYIVTKEVEGETRTYGARTLEAAQKLASMQFGGLISEPTLLSRLSDMRPYAIAGEKGMERVSPMDSGYKTANIYFQLDGRTIVKLVGQDLVDEIRLRTGIRGV